MLYRKRKIQWVIFNRWLKYLELETLNCTHGLIPEINMIRKKYFSINQYLKGEFFGVAVCVNSDRCRESFVCIKGKNNFFFQKKFRHKFNCFAANSLARFIYVAASAMKNQFNCSDVSPLFHLCFNSFFLRL